VRAGGDFFLPTLALLLWACSAQANPACSACHNPLPDNVAQGCAQCHSAEQIRVAALTATQLPTQAAAAGNAPATLGMSVPMFYTDTRIGKDPSPMVLVPAGEFIMGTDARLPDEGPQHKVKLVAFYIDKYETTNLQYEQFIQATERRSPIHFKNRTFPEGRVDHPVMNVSWEDAHDYCAWAGKRLPTDQEWEKAARGTDGRTFPWGNEFDPHKANVPGRWKELGAFGDTTPVGAFEAGKSPYGVYDLSGNVWEWTDSWYQPYPGNKVASENYGERYKTLKGGSWFDCSFYQCGVSAPVFNRAFFAVRTKNDSFGFRCAKTAK
jgi:formylglycine-generating enzyme required for sulfatase activity